MPDPQAAGGDDLKKFKSQPWILFDTVVASSFLIGDSSPAGLAIGSTIPAINSNGEMIFFSSSGRNTANTPWYTNLDQQSTLSFGLEVWQIYLLFAFPAVTPNQNNGFDPTVNAGVPPTTKLIEAILNFGVVELELGQENQMRWPCTRFGAGGGLTVSNTAAVVENQNSLPQGANVMKLPEPIEMPRTQNINAKIRIAPEARAMIGTPAAPGVGTPLVNYSYVIATGETPATVSLAQFPFAVQLGLVGRRVKDTQYGQIPGGR
jgi:hypothetical protein